MKNFITLFILLLLFTSTKDAFCATKQCLYNIDISQATHYITDTKTYDTKTLNTIIQEKTTQLGFKSSITNRETDFNVGCLKGLNSFTSDFIYEEIDKDASVIETKNIFFPPQTDNNYYLITTDFWDAYICGKTPVGVDESFDYIHATIYIFPKNQKRLKMIYVWFSNDTPTVKDCEEAILHTINSIRFVDDECKNVEQQK